MAQSFLDKNLNCIRKYDNDLANDLLNIQELTGNYEFSNTKCDDVNLIFNDTPLHDEIDALDEASKMCKNIQDKEANVVHFIFGLGLGYFFKKLASQTKGKIVVYEPNIEVLKITLEVVDFSEELSNPNIKIVNNLLKLKPTSEYVYKKNDNITLSFLESYKKLYPIELSSFIKELGILKSQFATGYKELARLSRKWAIGSMKNLSHIYKNEEIEALRGEFKGKTAVIVSAGPSLNKGIEAIKKYRENIVVFCVNVALKTLIHNEITPDFVCAIEAGGCISSLEGIDTSDLNFILPPEVNPDIYNRKMGHVFNYYTENIISSDWIQSITDISCLDYKNRGTVSITTFWSAYLMGFDPIILIGQDLAFSEGKCYSKNAAFDLVCEINQETGDFEIKPTDLEKYIEQSKSFYKMDDEDYIRKSIEKEFKKRTSEITKIKGQNGELLPTSAGYALFVKHFEELTTEIENSRKLYNASEGGAQINGYENKPLEAILELHNPEKINTNKIIDNAINTYKKPYTKEAFCKKIDDNIETLKSCLNLAKKGAKSSEKLYERYKRTKKLTPDLNVLLNKTNNTYIEIIQKYFKNKLIMSLMYHYYDLVEEAMTKEDSDTTKIDDIIKNLHLFISTTINLLSDAIKELRYQKEIL